jgi:lysophospholipase L1-like esterase
VSINADGLRDRDHGVAKPPGTFRIAVLGDSMTEAMQVPRERDFCSILEARLRGCPRLAGKSPEVLNFGVSGYGTAQELLMLRERVWKYSPDLVVLAMFPGNDIRNNRASLNKETFCPYYSYEDGRLTLHLPPPPRTDALRRFRDALSDHSRVLQLVNQVRKALRTRGADQMVVKDRDPRTFGEQGVDDATFAPPKTVEWSEAWRLTEGLLRMMRDDVRAHGAAFAITLLPSGIQVYPDAGVRAAYARRAGAESLSYAHERIAVFARSEGILVIPLEGAMRGYAESHRAMLHGFPNSVPGFGHLNEAGHRAAGEMLAAQICEQP